jgi:hypothetical protein
MGASGKDGRIARSSSIGPILADRSGWTKPDLLAQELAALMWSAKPGLIGQIEDARQILVQTAQTPKVKKCE